MCRVTTGLTSKTFGMFQKAAEGRWTVGSDQKSTS